jgi:hypothetical protein
MVDNDNSGIEQQRLEQAPGQHGKIFCRRASITVPGVPVTSTFGLFPLRYTQVQKKRWSLFAISCIALPEDSPNISWLSN